MTDIRIFPDDVKVTRAAAEWIIEQAHHAIGANGRFSWALSGGSTPKSLYRLLASSEFVERIEWSKVHVFWGDERCVLPDHAESSYRMARETLLDHVPILHDNIYRVRGELSPQSAANEYETELRAFFGSLSLPKFDVVLLGMGDDGHTASLFPGTTALVETEQCVVANYVDKLGVWRITLTPPAINAAKNILFLVTGANKASRLRDVLQGERQPIVLPAQGIHPVDGQLIWMLDAAAASDLD